MIGLWVNLPPWINVYTVLHSIALMPSYMHFTQCEEHAYNLVAVNKYIYMMHFIFHY